VFEPRYCELVEAALADDRLVATALLMPGWEHDYDGRPPVHEIGCLGRVTAHHQREDGSYNVMLLGLRRVRLLGDLPAPASFRVVRIEALAGVFPPGDTAAVPDLKRRLQGALAWFLPRGKQTEDHFSRLLGSDVSLERLTDAVSSMLDVDLGKKQALLAEGSVCRRAEQLLGHLAVAAVDTSPGRFGAAAFPPEIGIN
jgi:Lon protease-like protein